MNLKSYPSQFWLLCLSSFLFFGSFNMIISELPEFLSKLGGANYKGLIISLFTVTALLSRPFSGKLADSIGRVPVMVFGSVVCLVCSLIYPVLTTINGFFLLRLAHGFSVGFTPTGFTAYVADIVPLNKRGEAMGLLSTFGTLGMSASPAIGGWIAYKFSLDAVFYYSSAFGLLAMLVYVNVKETLPNKESFRYHHIKLKLKDIYEPTVILPCVIMSCTAYAFGVMLTLIPDLSESLGMMNKGILFMGFTLASVVVRVVAGKMSDRFGRRLIVIISSSLIAISMIIVGFASNTIALWTGGLLYGVAYGMTSPTLFAWVTDISNENNRGRAFGSLYIALEFGIGLGAFISGLTFANNPDNFPLAFSTSSVLALVALFILVITRPSK